MRKESLRDDLVELRKHRPTRASRMWEVTMAVKLDDYRELLEGINPTLRDSLTANFTAPQQERRGTLLVDNQRKLNLYLRARWARDFFLRPTSGDYESREGYKPFIEQRVIHLPDAYDDYAGIAGGELYRAAAAHAAAHLVYTRAPISAEALTPTQMIFIGLFEDARVEHLAIADFPGLKQLWSQFHEKLREVSCAVDPVVELLERAAYAMLDDSYVDVDPWVRGAAAAFREEFAQRPHDNRLSWDLGGTFYNELGGHHSIPSLRVLESVAIPYRDDNR